MIRWGSFEIQGSFWQLMASSCPDYVALQVDQSYHGRFRVVPMYYSNFVVMVNL
jgi:hypothetical protein